MTRKYGKIYINFDSILFWSFHLLLSLVFAPFIIIHLLFNVMYIFGCRQQYNLDYVSKNLFEKFDNLIIDIAMTVHRVQRSHRPRYYYYYFVLDHLELLDLLMGAEGFWTGRPANVWIEFQLPQSMPKERHRLLHCLPLLVNLFAIWKKGETKIIV